MKMTLPAYAVVLAAMMPVMAHAESDDCINPDPLSALSAITGDFEISADPVDPAHMLFTSNAIKASTKPQDVVVAQLDGVTGEIVPGSLTTIATNFHGDSDNNGPSWMETPSGQVGILFVGSGGVRAVFRNPQPITWSDFLYNYDGTPSDGQPSLLPNTGSGEYPGSPPGVPIKAATYPFFYGACTSLCYAAYNKGTATDVGAVLSQFGYTGANSTQGDVDGSLYVSACTSANSCGLYQTKIDNMGGLGSLIQIASMSKYGAISLAVIRHPITGTLLIFTNSDGPKINVWEQTTSGATLNKIATVQAPPGFTHFRAVSSATEVVLNYFVRAGLYAGSYTIPVTASGSTLIVGDSKMIGKVSSGSEFDWFPAANQWAYYYRKIKGSQPPQYFRCWVTP